MRLENRGLALLLVALAAACSGAEKTDCNDGIDNDGDGRIDDVDPGCAHNGGVLEAPDPTDCNDGLDNDEDGLIDDQDWGCDGTVGDDDETDPTRACNDGVDNDADKKTDFPGDPGCENPVDDDEFNPAACGDTSDNDGDGLIDFPFEPGCTSTDDDDETDPDSPPACADGIDNDGDMLIDVGQDPGCGYAGDTDEFNTTTGACGPGVIITDISATRQGSGTFTSPLPNELTSDVCHGYGGELAFTYTVASGPRALVVTTDHPETTLDTVVYVRSECRRADRELGCDDDSGSNGHSSTLVIPDVPAGTYYIVVDAFGPGSLGSFRVTVQERTALHGACDPSDPNACVMGLICRAFTPGAANTCEYHVCGDGVDNDADGKTDYPVEPGCLSRDDDTEEDPTPLPQCGNGTDDDRDTFVDYPDDPGCDFAGDTVELDECYPGTPVNFLDPVAGVSGSTSGASAASGTCGGGSSAERVYALTPSVPLASLTLSTNNATTSFDTVLYVRDGDCDGGAEVACNDNISGWTNSRSEVTFTPTAGHTYYVFVDGSWGTGTFRLDVSGLIAAGGECAPDVASFACQSGYACRESAPAADDWQCRAAFCSDTIDNDSDGTVDFPDDPGCASPSDDNEDFPNPVTACSNGVDDDADGETDFPDDPGCGSASDNGEIDECLPGVPVVDHPGGSLDGDTTGGTSRLTAPYSCDSGTSSSTERVYAFRNLRTLASLSFEAVGGTLDPILYVRQDDCSIAGPEAWCVNDWSRTTSAVTIDSPAVGNYFAIVDGSWGDTGTFTMNVTGEIAGGEPCDAADTAFTCVAGYACSAGTCQPTECNDGVDNADPEDTDADAADPGCTDITDTSETDPATLPQCGNGTDDDADGLIDYPMDPGCDRAGDDVEQDCDDTDAIIDVTYSGGTYSGTTVGATNDASGVCVSAPGSDVVHVLRIPGQTSVTAQTCSGASWDTVVYIKNDCSVTSTLACNDDFCSVQSSVTATLAAGTYFIYVDGYGSGSAGAYTLSVTGTIANNQPCDPAQVVTGFLQCGAGRTCRDTGTGFKCQ